MRLVVIALIPLLAVGLFAGAAINRRWEDARSSAEVTDRLTTIGLLMQLQLHLDEELLPSQASVQASTFGVTVAEVGALLGFDVGKGIIVARDAVDITLDRIAEDGVVDLSESVRQIAQMRVGIDDGSIAATDIRRAINSIGGAIATLAKVQVAEVQSVARQLDNDRVERAIHDLLLVHELVNTSNRQLPMLFDAMLGSLAGGSPTSALELARVTGWYRVTADRFDSELQGTPAVAWQALRSNPSNARFENAIDDLLADGASSVGPANVSELAGLVSSGFARSLAHFNVFEAASVDSVAAADAASQTATDELRNYTMFVAAVMVATVLLLVLVARSISRPLRRLVHVAERVDAGSIAGVTMPRSRGPREVRVVSDAFADLLGGLKVVDEQTNALAAGDLDAPILRVNRPGRLAANLRESVRLLSTSIAERDRLYAQLRHEATHDSVTGLPNRSALLDNISGALERYRGRVASLGLLVIQLDGLRRANDVHGHEIGDAVLAEAGRRLAGAAGGFAEVARLGDDEFIAVGEDESLDELVELGERVVRAFAAPVEVSGRVVYLSACVGIARAVDASTTRAELMRGASIAASNARTLGRTRVEVFNDDLRGVLARSAELERALAAALAADELRFELQPVWDLSQHRATGFEALARWTRPDGTVVAPIDFVAAAELSDLVIDLDNFVMMSAARAVAEWNRAHGCDFTIAVNISGRHLLTHRVIDDVRNTLELTGLEPDRLVVEITETVVLTDLEIATAHLAELRDLGVRIAIDDFGSGYTSLVHLRTLPADILKIDRAFVSDLDSVEGRSLMKVLVEAAHTLDLGIVAEGVETLQQLQELERLQCDEVQGYYLGRPMPVGEVEALFIAGLPAVD